MKKASIAFFTVFITLQIISLNSSISFAQINNKISEQGGVLKFNHTTVQREIGSQQNAAQIILTGYSGRSLKAMQFNLIVGKNGGNLILKSVSRGTGISPSSFLFDFEIYKGPASVDGSSIDTVKVVLLGNGTNVIVPGGDVHLLTITYDVVYSNTGNFLTHLSLDGVLGATSSPVENANIIAGDDQVIYLVNPSIKQGEGSLLLQNYPNPFNPNTMINYVLTNDEYVTLKIFNSIGQEVATLVNDFQVKGEYKIGFDAGALSSGVYLYQVRTKDFLETRKMILIK